MYHLSVTGWDILITYVYSRFVCSCGFSSLKIAEHEVDGKGHVEKFPGEIMAISDCGSPPCPDCPLLLDSPVFPDYI
ncbi:hypothetical protein J6590_073558 [Homalodisca vitripennis]|nr:hypothetical protein J6590_073558 [Homalodisca vitripennis]